MFCSCDFSHIFCLQLLKGLFGTNAASDPDVYVLASCTRDLIEARGDPTFLFDNSSPALLSTESDGVTLSAEQQLSKNLYEDCFILDYKKMCASLKMVPLADSNSLERGYVVYCVRVLGVIYCSRKISSFL